MEKKADIIPFLESVVEKNTRSYQSDFAYDEKRLQAAMLEMYQEPPLRNALCSGTGDFLAGDRGA